MFEIIGKLAGHLKKIIWQIREIYRQTGSCDVSRHFPLQFAKNNLQH